MTKIYRAYIDEAGDEGLTKLHLPRTAGGGQSRWLVLGGMIVAEPNNRLTAGWRDDIADKQGAKNLCKTSRIYSERIMKWIRLYL